MSGVTFPYTSSLITITGARLVSLNEAIQISLLDEEEESKKRETLEKTIQNLRSKYGHGTIKTADVLDNEIVMSESHIKTEQKKT